MSEKKYDLSQVSQAAKDAYCQARIDFEITRDAAHEKDLKYIGEKMCEEAEVRPKTARDILEGAVTYWKVWGVNPPRIMSAIEEALKVLP